MCLQDIGTIMDVADYYGIATGNKMPDKFEKSGYHAEKVGQAWNAGKDIMKAAQGKE